MESYNFTQYKIFSFTFYKFDETYQFFPCKKTYYVTHFYENRAFCGLNTDPGTATVTATGAGIGTGTVKSQNWNRNLSQVGIRTVTVKIVTVPYC
jgi:hypothetical protein